MEHPACICFLNTTVKKLWFCILMDVIGLASYLLPAFGEWTDIVWGPVSAIIFYMTFGGKTGQVGAFVNLLEETLPFTDIIPTFTIAYFYERKRNSKPGHSGPQKTTT